MKTCFCLLLPNNLNITAVNKCLNNLYNFYLCKYPTDVVIFHETGFSQNNKKIINNLLPKTNIIFKQIEFSIPNIVSNDENFKPKWTETYWGPEKCISYGGMCTFFTRDIFNYLNEMGYEYYARLDDDSYILNSINYNIFEYMKNNNLIYGYVIKMLEAPHVVNGLFNFIVDNIEKEKILNKDYTFTNSANLVYYYNNFEIVHVQKYLNITNKINNKIHESGNIYYWRWGDAPIRTILISMLFDTNAVKKLSNIDYQHAGVKIINNLVQCRCKLPEQT